MLNRRYYTRNGHGWNPMPDMELESSYLLGGGSRKGGFGRTPRTPPPPLVTGLMLSVTVLHGNENKTSIFIHITFFDFKSSIVFTI